MAAAFSDAPVMPHRPDLEHHLNAIAAACLPGAGLARAAASRPLVSFRRVSRWVLDHLRHELWVRRRALSRACAADLGNAAAGPLTRTLTNLLVSGRIVIRGGAVCLVRINMPHNAQHTRARTNRRRHASSDPAASAPRSQQRLG